ncbi:MAG: SdrD B-like domain-containing protein, partial [Pseudomonadota bacterium]|nr:SdrD B-like domain-containing protein [Pseudomonadota bacterium]
MLMTQHVHALTDQAPEAGVTITNTAAASYFLNGANVEVASNTVAVDVAALYAIHLTSGDLQKIEAGEAVTWLNQLSNLSNTQATIDLSHLAPDSLGSMRIYYDKNDNGLIDADDQELTQEVIVLERGQSIQLIVTGLTDAGLSPTTSPIELPIRADVVEDDSVFAQAIDPFIIIAPELVAIKEVDRTEIDPSNNSNVNLTYKLKVESRGTAAVRPTELVVDGQPLSAVIVRDPLPANTTFVSITPEQANAKVLYRTAGNALTEQRPADLSSIDEVLLAYPAGLPTSSTVSATLVVAMNAGVSNTTLVNTMYVDYGQFSSSTPKTKPSNPVETNVLGRADIYAKTPDYTTSINTSKVKEPLYIEVNAAACNFDRTIQNKAWVEVTSQLTGDQVRVLAEETSANSGIYRYQLETNDTLPEAADLILQIMGDDKVDIELTSCADENNQPILPQTDVKTQVTIDPYGAALFVQKTVHEQNLEIGDFADYTVKITNRGQAEASNVKMLDTLPIGFTYVPNTTRVTYSGTGFNNDVVRVADPEGNKGRYLTLGLNNLPPQAEAQVTYRVHIGPNAVTGDGINRVRASGSATSINTPITSNEAQVKVKVSSGVFMDEALIIGKVYADCNRNGMQDSGERGVPGVRLYLEDGSFVVTDSEGKYSFYGVSAKTHVLKLDRTSLPADVELIEQSNRDAGVPGSRFVDLKRGELHRADFAMTDGMSDCSTALDEQIDI